MFQPSHIQRGIHGEETRISRRELEFSEGTSNKFWAIELSGSQFTVNWGRIGTAGQSQTKSFGSDADAKKQYDKLIEEKTSKDYKDVGAGGRRHGGRNRRRHRRSAQARQSRVAKTCGRRAARARAEIPVISNSPLATIGASRMITAGGKCSPDYTLTIGRARASVTPQSFAGETLRAPALTEDFQELKARLGALPIASLRPRHIAENLHVCPSPASWAAASIPSHNPCKSSSKTPATSKPSSPTPTTPVTRKAPKPSWPHAPTPRTNSNSSPATSAPRAPASRSNPSCSSSIPLAVAAPSNPGPTASAGPPKIHHHPLVPRNRRPVHSPTRPPHKTHPRPRLTQFQQLSPSPYLSVVNHQGHQGRQGGRQDVFGYSPRVPGVPGALGGGLIFFYRGEVHEGDLQSEIRNLKYLESQILKARILKFQILTPAAPH